MNRKISIMLLIALSGCNAPEGNLPAPIPEFPVSVNSSPNLPAYTVSYLIKDSAGKSYERNINDIKLGVPVYINEQKSIPYLKQSEITTPGSGVPDEEYGTLKTGPKLLLVIGDPDSKTIPNSTSDFIRIGYKYSEIAPDAMDGTYFNKFNYGESKIELPAVRSISKNGNLMIETGKWTEVSMPDAGNKPGSIRLLIKRNL